MKRMEKAVVFEIPNDNFKCLYAETFQTEDELYDYVIGLTDAIIVSIIDVKDTYQLESILINMLDDIDDEWDLKGFNYEINKFTGGRE